MAWHDVRIRVSVSTETSKAALENQKPIVDNQYLCICGQIATLSQRAALQVLAPVAIIDQIAHNPMGSLHTDQSCMLVEQFWDCQGQHNQAAAFSIAIFDNALSP